jgi:Domain of unknown function (DUF4411)
VTVPTIFWVIDTSSIIEVRRFVPRTDQPTVFGRLDVLVISDSLVYPAQVVDELERYSDASSNNPDLPFQWAKRNQVRASRHGPQFEKVREVLAHPQVRNILDPEKTGVEEADAYVLGLAMHLKDQGEVTVITEERRDRPDKLSMNTACGLLRLYCLSMKPFLAQQGIWS